MVNKMLKREILCRNTISITAYIFTKKIKVSKSIYQLIITATYGHPSKKFV